MNENAILRTVPAAGELHKVPGFDPMEHLHSTVDSKGETVMRLEPRYQRLWFRLACPKGRMLLNPLRLTDQLAIFEAKVFFHRDDTTPASSFTAAKTAQETRSYIRAAQDEALMAALDNAGFGIQLCDMSQPQTEQHQARETSAASAPGESRSIQASSDTRSAAFAQVMEASAAVEKDPKPTPELQAVEQELKPAAVTEATPDQAERQTIPEADRQTEPMADGQQAPQITVLNFTAQATEYAASQESAPVGAADTAPDVPTAASTTGSSSASDATFGHAETPPQDAPSYTEDTPVEEICQAMTLEEARSVVVTQGTCNGWTMGKVADQRPSSIKFYLSGFGRCSNIQLAAATLMMRELEQKKTS